MYDLENMSEAEIQELAENISEEEFEQLDELSQGTLHSYINKAAMDSKKNIRSSKARFNDGMRAGPNSADRHWDKASDHEDHAQKRLKGIGTAAKKISKKISTGDHYNESLEEGTAAADTLKTKSASMAAIVKRMEGMSHDDITKFSEVINQVGKEADQLPGRANAASNKSSVAMKEDLALIFGKDNENVSEEFLDEITTLFEAALNLRLSVEREQMFEEAAEVVQEMVNEQVEQILEGVDAYLAEAVEEWKEENSLAIESGVKLNQMESFLDGLRTLFLEHDIEVPEEQLDLVESLTAELEELKEQLNESLNKNLEFEKILEDAQLEHAFDELSEGLAATQIEKLKTLVEGISYNDVDDFKSKVALIKESTFGKATPSADVLTEEKLEERVEEARKPTGDMARYTAAISQQARFRK